MIDLIDKKLVFLLGQNALQSSEELAKQLDVSPTTVRRRLRRLLKDKVLRIVGTVNPLEFGSTLHLVIGLDVVHDKLIEAKTMLIGRNEIVWVGSTTGRFNIICIAHFASNNTLSTFLKEIQEKIEGLRCIETFICLDADKGAYVPLKECDWSD
jgi:DNA-binding Lrp family transcriptional regulator